MSLVDLPIGTRFPACSFQAPLYPIHVALIPCGTGQKRAGEIKALLPAIPTDLLRRYDTSAHASVITNLRSELPWLVFVTAEPDATLVTIAHEVFHLTHRVMEYVKADFEHETHAYLYEFLFRTISLVTHEKSDIRVGFDDHSMDSDMIEFLNSEHNLGLTSMTRLNKIIEDYLHERQENE